MELIDKAKEYALDALSGQIETVMQAYMDGYNDAKMKYSSDPVSIDGIEYYDIGLPSGNLWSSLLTKENSNDSWKGPYCDIEHLNIPTKEDIDEMIKYTQKMDDFRRRTLTGKLLHLTRGENIWYKSTSETDTEAGVFGAEGKGALTFKGNHKYAILVKHK